MIETDGEGGVIVAWMDYRSGSSDIYAQHVLASGVVDPAWPTDGTALCTAPVYEVLSCIVSDGAGGAIVTWVGGSYGVRAQHVLSSGVVDPAWPVDGRELLPGEGTIVTVSDGAGGAYIAWSGPIGGGPVYSGYYDIHAQHVLASGDLNPAWPINGLAVCSAPRDQRFPAFVSDGTGGAFLTWGDDRPSGRGDYVQHLLPSGVDPAWPPRASSSATARRVAP